MNSICCSRTADFLSRLEDRLSLAEEPVRAEYSAAMKAGVALAVRRTVLEMAGRHADELALDADEREELCCLLRSPRLRLYLSTSYRTEIAPDAETLERYAHEADHAAAILTGTLTLWGYSVFSPVSVRHALASPCDSPELPDHNVWRQNCLPLLRNWADRLLLLTTPEWLDDQEIRQEIFEARAAGIPVQVLSADTLCSTTGQIPSVLGTAPIFHLHEGGQDLQFILHVYADHLGVPLPRLEALVDCLGLKATLDLLEEWGNETLKRELELFALLCVRNLEAYVDFSRDFPRTLNALNFRADYLEGRLPDDDIEDAPDMLGGMTDDAELEYGPEKSRPETQAAYAALLAARGEGAGKVFENCLGVFTLLKDTAARESFMEAAKKDFLSRFPSHNRPEQGGKHDGGLS